MQETKCNNNTLVYIHSKAWLGCQTVMVDVNGASRGLAIAWNTHNISLTDFHASHHFIQATFHIIGTNIHGHLKNLYLPQNSMQKNALLNMLENLNSTRIHPLWITGGDFNMITKLEEKKGDNVKLDNERKFFKDYIQNNWLIDFPFDTWNNKRSGSQQIASRLDKFLILDNSVHLGGNIIASILPLSGSDHWPISLQWTRPRDSIRKPFRFATFWLTHPDFKNIVNSAWDNFTPPEGSIMYQFQ